MMMKVESLWRVLEQERHDIVSGYLTRRILPEVNYDVYLAVERPANMRALMIRISTDCLDQAVIYPSSNSFAVNRISLPKDNGNYITLQLTLTNARNKDIFTSLVQDIVDHLASILEERPAVLAFTVRLKRWQKFLEKNNPNGLSEAAQQGLYGELWFLKTVVLLNLDLITAIQHWTGPKGSSQDFQFPVCAVEVKTTRTKQHQKLSIASERQLDDTGTGTVVLLHLSLDIRKGQGETLPEIVSNVRSIVADDVLARDKLEDILFEAGYLDIHAKHYENTSYTVRENNYFEVKEDFPKILESDLRNGVGDVRYTISVAECRRFLISESDVIALIGAKP